MTGWCIAAIPRDNDPVWKYSSEDIPHMTLLFLGEQDENSVDLEHMSLYIQHIAQTSLHPFYMTVDSRGLLGKDSADVLFFKKDRFETQYIQNIRANLLADPQIFAAYNSTEQYPEWTPHLTMGYPTAPAKKDDREYSDFWGVEFDRIALWTGEFTGPTFKLEYPEREASDMAMEDAVGTFFAHYGVQGMKWGKRTARPVNRNEETLVRTAPAKKPGLIEFEKKRYQKTNADTAVTVTHRPGQRLSTKGGSNRTPSDDALRTAAAKRVAKSSTTDALSTKELQELVNRMNLEQQYQKLTAPQMSPGRKFVNNLLTEVAKSEAQKVIKSKIPTSNNSNDNNNNNGNGKKNK